MDAPLPLVEFGKDQVKRTWIVLHSAMVMGMRKLMDGWMGSIDRNYEQVFQPESIDQRFRMSVEALSVGCAIAFGRIW